MSINFVFDIIFLTYLIADSVSSTETDTELAETKIYSNDHFVYSFEVPVCYFEGHVPGECNFINPSNFSSSEHS